MFKIAIGQINHESNPMALSPTTLDDFKRCTWFEGAAIFPAYAGVNDYIAGMIDKGRKLKVTLVPTLSTTAPPSGLITDSCYSTLKSTLINGLIQQAPFDGICLALHGAGEADSCRDIEGDLLKDIRAYVGADIPIVISLDLHSHITPEMVANCNAMIGVKHYPHIDYHETGAKAMDLLVRTLTGAIVPVMSIQRIPMLVFPSMASTFESPAKDVLDYSRELATKPGILDCTFIHGFPYGDMPHTAAYAVVTADANQELANNTAMCLKDFAWGLRERFVGTFPEPDEGIALAMKSTRWPVVINETSDNPGSGTPGDGTYLLRALLNANEPKTCFGFIYDPEVAAHAHRAGIGARINIRLGGKTDTLHGEPILIHDAHVAALADGVFKIISPMMTGATVNLGPTARLTVGNVDIIVAGTRIQTFDDQLFKLVGIDITQYRLVALKSIQHFKAYFNQVAGDIITVDPPGLSTSRIERLTFKHLEPTMFPFQK